MELQSGAYTHQLKSKGSLTPSKTIPACSIRSIQNHSNFDAPVHTWNSSSLPPAPVRGQSQSHSKTEHLYSKGRNGWAARTCL
ncbi:hypothetical protein AVEN_121397-1 [Araneus ventricosus]|uniref:Uncharacterized protein n=1 Tax=Araneus ventricosus TaxID=182803 RepID=A0A4Y2CPM5_ARAVE|nr:hypothetical protein AVEN_121397-1 [Araneus ventricosus]